MSVFKVILTHLRFRIGAEADEIRNDLYWMHQALTQHDLDDAHCHETNVEITVEEAIENLF